MMRILTQLNRRKDHIEEEEEEDLPGISPSSFSLLLLSFFSWF